MRGPAKMKPERQQWSNDRQPRGGRGTGKDLRLYPNGLYCSCIRLMSFVSSLLSYYIIVIKFGGIMVRKISQT